MGFLYSNNSYTTLYYYNTTPLYYQNPRQYLLDVNYEQIFQIHQVIFHYSSTHSVGFLN